MFDPAGEGARQITDLFWQMTAGAALIWLAVVTLTVYSVYRRPSERARSYGKSLIVGGGVIFPTVVLAGLLVYGLAMLPPLLAAAPEGSLRIAVSGEQYWWRVRYPGADVELANEVRLPVQQHVEFELTSKDVIHSFWVPALGGKVDMIPGRTNRLTLFPTRAGEFRGVCAEFCGASHALMALRVIVLPPDEFEAWLARQTQPAHAQRDARGEELFSSNGCGACHTVRGTAAQGVLGPDLTHVGSRTTLGAGTLANDAAQFERWLSETETVKPGVLMPHFGMLRREDVRVLAKYLESLQ